MEQLINFRRVSNVFVALYSAPKIAIQLLMINQPANPFLLSWRSLEVWPLQRSVHNLLNGAFADYIPEDVSRSGDWAYSAYPLPRAANNRGDAQWAR